jgi:hypothetical protein
MAMKNEVDVFWVVTPCSVAVGYQRFGEPCCLHLQGVAPAWRAAVLHTENREEGGHLIRITLLRNILWRQQPLERTILCETEEL